MRHPTWLKKLMLGRQSVQNQSYQESIIIFFSYQKNGFGHAQLRVLAWCMMHDYGSGALVGGILCSLSILDSPRSSLFLLYLDPKKQFPRTDLLGRDIPPFRSWRD